MLTALLALSVALPTDALAEAPCGTADCPALADVSIAVEAAERAEIAEPAEVWGGLTDVDPGDYADRGLDPAVLELALTAWATAWSRGESSSKLLTVIDFSMSSDNERFWVLDLETGEVLFQEHVSHGKHSGNAIGSRFSNVDESNQSSVGLMITAETYHGKHGYSMRFDGMEDGFNDNVRSRHIVMHKADYMTDSFIRRVGRAGRSLGCTALDPDVYRQVIDTIKGGSLVFSYGEDSSWLRNSEYLGEAGREHAESLGMSDRPTLRRGADGADVEYLQSRLQAAGFYDGPVDGDFGRGTKRAVEAFQADRGLTPDGVVGGDTWRALG